MYRKLICILALMLLVSSMAFGQNDLFTYKRVTSATGIFYDTLADTVSTTSLGVSSKVRIFDADFNRGYDAVLFSFIVEKLDTATNSWGYIDSLNKNDSVIIRLMVGQNGYYRQLGTHTTSGANPLPDTFNIEYGFPDDSLAGMLFDSLWFDCHVYDSVMTSDDSALITVNYQYKLIEYYQRKER